MSKVMTTLCAISFASLILFVGAGQVQAQYSENFETSLSDGDSVTSLPGWSGSLTAASPPDLGGNRGLVTENPGDFGGANLDLSGQGLQPSASDSVYEIRSDAFLFSGDGNQYMSAHGNTSAGGRWFETTWQGDGTYYFRIWGAGDAGTPILVNPAAADPLGDTNGLRTFVFRIDPGAGTAEGLIETASGNVSLGSAAFPTTNFGDFSRLTIGADRRGSQLGTQFDTFSIVVPEPSTMMLAGAGLFGLTLGWRRRRNR